MHELRIKSNDPTIINALTLAIEEYGEEFFNALANNIPSNAYANVFSDVNVEEIEVDFEKNLNDEFINTIKL